VPALFKRYQVIRVMSEVSGDPPPSRSGQK
jgi:hypothetical protein